MLYTCPSVINAAREGWRVPPSSRERYGSDNLVSLLSCARVHPCWLRNDLSRVPSVARNCSSGRSIPAAIGSSTNINHACWATRAPLRRFSYSLDCDHVAAADDAAAGDRRVDADVSLIGLDRGAENPE